MFKQNVSATMEPLRVCVPRHVFRKGLTAVHSISKAVITPERPRAKGSAAAELAAIKVIKLEPGDDFAIIQQEILMMKDCRHPNIVAYYGSYLRRDKLWISMEYCGGGSLQDIYHVTGQLTELDCIHVQGKPLRSILFAQRGENASAPKRIEAQDMNRCMPISLTLSLYLSLLRRANCARVEGTRAFHFVSVLALRRANHASDGDAMPSLSL
ncbi:hypothetical protein EVAR_67949_1 [Eumeta japonica]|uniref:Protein kinase domain-containing protein n=1 Tax=Eumeta variegata TaxID=151549 RepID=A0A4C1ZWY5_EUMVA|nr:hypothetical protein EVAR_67949_1 [Eumeta japonica]